MFILLMLLLLLYLLNKFNSSKLDLPKIRNELQLASQEASEQLPKNQTILQAYLDLKLSLSSQMDDIRKKENLSHEELTKMGNGIKIIIETARDLQSCIIAKTRAGSTYAGILFADEIIKIANDREIVLNAIISLSAEIILLSVSNPSENIIYDKIQYLTKAENALNVLTKKLYFKMNCFQDLVN